MAVLIFILILGVLVFVHELGHFLVARRNGITAHEFGFGFPPRFIGIYRDDKNKKWNFVRGSKEVETKNTIYSLNWFPIGGFVKIKGEDGSGKGDADSFASKSAWKRIKVLAAGVAMNFILAWALFSAGLMIGTYQEVPEGNLQNSKILISSVAENSPAKNIGIKLGDEILSGGKNSEIVFQKIEDVQDYINSNRGKEVMLEIKRGEDIIEFSGIPREDKIEGQGALGIGLSQVEIVRYSFFKAAYYGLIEMGNVLLLMFETFRQLFIGNASGIELTGIVGIAVYTGDVIPLGIVQLFRFAALLSINLGIINILPFPALDGGRILFIIIEKIKRSPVSEKVENAFHTAGFMLLILLMVLVTFKDLVRFEIVDKIKGLF
ncbi:MAG: Membrane-associated zinc metalloprotease [uncultured bacterium]|nr:MAG: Membrane-associated zinc metalloprotease [uncultured bacterium]HBR71574.1 RIP metalloprotease RseP [Candidatus Moranbacteria bacterium]